MFLGKKYSQEKFLENLKGISSFEKDRGEMLQRASFILEICCDGAYIDDNIFENITIEDLGNARAILQETDLYNDYNSPELDSLLKVQSARENLIKMKPIKDLEDDDDFL